MSKKRKTGAELRREQHLLPEILDGFPIGRHGRACAVLARSIRNLKKRERKPVNGITISPAEKCLHGTCFIPPGWSGLWNLCTGCRMSILVRVFATPRIEMFRKISISSENSPYPLSNRLKYKPPPNTPFPTSCLTAFLSLTLLSLFGVKIDFRALSTLPIDFS